MKNDQTKYTGLEIAVIGMACRFLGASDWRQFWNTLANGDESIQILSDRELIELRVEETLIKKPEFVKVMNVFKGKDTFDSTFFEYRPEEVRVMNPVHRVFHECVWEALEDAGCNPDQIRGPIGLFAGANEDPDWKNHVLSLQHGLDNLTLTSLANKDYLATLLAYKLNLTGPAITINTACSTSLVAINLACKSLLLGESTIALAGGASILSRDHIGYLYQEGMIGSLDGHCRTFDKNASGTVRGEGAGIVVLKRLREAIADNDNIHAIIKGSMVNNDGNGKVGFTAPSVKGQADCIRKALQFAKVEPDSIGYVEAHGTGTHLGDPIEVEALNIAFNRNTNHKCALGSVKTNMGHLDTAAGIAGFIKTVLSLKYKQLPPSLHFTAPNPEIDFAAGPFYVNTQLNKWPIDNVPARASVSSFGIGGTNAHVVLEQAPEIEPSSDAGRSYKMLMLSAKSEDTLTQYSRRLKNFLLSEQGVDLSDMCYTLQVGRKHFHCRKTFVFREKDDLIRSLESEGGMTTKSKLVDNVVFMFPGQGSQYVGMGQDLYKQEPVFRDEIEKGFSLLEKLTGEDFRPFIFSQPNTHLSIDQTRFTQPLLFVIEYALAKTLMSIGAKPQYLIGHSVGEYVAACLSNVFSFEDALRLVCTRATLMADLPVGEMISVALSEEEAKIFNSDEVSIAAVNSPQQVVLSGTPSGIGRVMETLKENETSFVRLHTSHAFHSSMLDPILDKFKTALSTVTTLNKPTIPIISNLTGRVCASEICSPEYWVNHMRYTVKFSEGIKTILAEKPDMLFIEVGPGKALTKLVEEHSKNKLSVTLQILGKTNQVDDARHFFNALSKMWEHGQDLNWKIYYQHEKRKRLSLPTYSFQPIPYPIDLTVTKPARSPKLVERHNEQKLANWVYLPSWSRITHPTHSMTAKHRLFVFFSNKDELSELIRNGIIENQGGVVEVALGDNFNRLSEYSYVLDPHNADHFKLLFDHLRDDHLAITDIIYSWNMSSHSVEVELSEDDFDLVRTYFAIARIAQALIQQESIHGKRITILSDTAYNVLGNEKMSVAQSLTLGLANVLRQEKRISVLNIDVDLFEDKLDVSRNIVSELCCDNTSELTVALRRGVRWGRSHQKYSRLPKSNSAIKPNTVILITGGLGNIGFALSKHLLETHQVKVVVVGRKGIAENNPLNQKAKSRFSQLESLGGQVKYYKTDVADFNELRKIIDEVERDLGEIKGVIHAAGVLDKRYFELIEDMSPAKTLSVFAPKIKGINNLYKIFGKRNLDFVWVTSSISTVLGGLSYSAYSASNLYMDHFITSRSAELPMWKCVDLAELGVGDPISSLKYPLLAPSEMLELFDWSVGLSHVPVILEAKGNLDLRMEEAYAIGTDPQNNDYVQQDFDYRMVRPEISSDYEAPQTSTETELAEIFADFFGMKSVGVCDDFFELGGDSLKAMMLLKRVKSRFLVDLPLTDLLAFPTIRLMSAKIDEMIWFKTDVEMENETTI